MPQYIFTHDTQDNSFPERLRVVTLEDDADVLREAENLTGTILDTEAIKFLDDLQARYESDESLLVQFVDAPSWSFIEARFRPNEVDE